MMPRRRLPAYSGPHPLENEVREIQSELWNARRTIIELVPEQFSALLRSYSECQSTGDFYRWRDRIVETIAKLVPEESITEFAGTRRANCPLCCQQTLGPCETGFVIPGGLVMHLTGYKNAHHCKVTKAAFDLGREYVERKYGEAERAAQKAANEENMRLTEARRNTEPLFKIHPTEPPELIDEGYRSWFWKNRDVESRAWAEARAISLGFAKHVNNNVQSLEKQQGDYVMYADIRFSKKIIFNVFRLPIAKGKKIKQARFDFPDHLKHDLEAKFETQLKEALNKCRLPSLGDTTSATHYSRGEKTGACRRKGP